MLDTASISELPTEFQSFYQTRDSVSETEIKVFSKANSSKQAILDHFLKHRETDDAFYIVDLYELVEQFKLWKKELPRVEPFYAVKCNPNPVILKTLAMLGCGFDVASKAEMRSVLDLNVSPSKLIYANPIKDASSIRFARSKDINILIFDCESELDKIKQNHPNAQLVLRIKADDCNSLFKFSVKFGSSVQEAKGCLEKAKLLGFEVIGVSFHVGSKCHDAGAFRTAISDSKEVFKIAESLGMKMTLLDIGGGFPGAEGETAATFEDQAKVINESIDTYFSDVKDVHIVAEPGRFFATKPYTVVMNVIGKKKKINEDNEPHFQYYMNDGIYSSFNIITYEQVTPRLKFIDKEDSKIHKSTMFGPTCDSLDTILKEVEMPELEIGDWCYVEYFGAYTHSLHCNFNGFPSLECKYIMRY